MRFIVAAVMSLISLEAMAITQGQFTGFNMIVNMASNMSDGSVDGSPQALFDSMNRPEQDSMAGRGKVLVVPKKVLNFICARRAENNYHCSIYIHKSEFSQIAPGMARFEVRGEQAKALFDQFHSQGGRYSYRDESSVFGIDATPDVFVLKYNSQGL